MSTISYTSSTDQEILGEIGARLRMLRESRGLSKTDAAERAGIARRTLYGAERGENLTLQTLIRLLRAYGRLGALESFLQVPEVSPMARLRERKRKQDG